MSQENAREFVEKYYSDEDFMIKSIKLIDVEQLLNGKGSADEIEARQNKLQTEMCNKAGYECTVEEYKAAIGDWVKANGAMASLKQAVKSQKIAKKIKKGKL